MAAKTSENSNRWKIVVPDDAADPIGSPDCARSAVLRLGPFKHQTHDQAQRYHGIDDRDGPLPLSKEFAFERVWVLATTFRRQQYLDNGAPRPRDVIEKLIKLEVLAAELACFMNSLDDMTRHRLQTGGSGIASFFETIEFPLRDEADAQGLPAPSGWKKSNEGDRWVDRLAALSRYANFTTGVFLRSKGIASIDDADKGGNTNLYKAQYGSASWALVSEGWHVYEMFRPGQATGTEGGPFHCFLMDVFEFATGLDPEEHSKLTHWLKRTSKAKWHYYELTSQERKLSRELSKINRSESGLSLEEREGRSQEIISQLQAVSRAQYEAWPSLFPFSYPNPKGR